MADEKYSNSDLANFLQGLKVETSAEIKGLIKQIKKNPKSYDNVEIEEYKLKWSGHTNPYNYIKSAQYTVTRYWRSEVERLTKEEYNDYQI